MPRPSARRFHQHAPALADAVAAADDLVERDEDVAAPVRAVLERDVQRDVALADLDAGRVAGHQRQGDAEVFLLAEQVLRIVQPEGQPDEGRHRAEGDVALLPVEPNAEHLVHPAIRPRQTTPRSGMAPASEPASGPVRREAGDLLAARQARQVVAPLLVGAVVQQQLCRDPASWAP